MTFVLVSVVYAVAVGEPSFGIMGPFAVGLALFAMVFAGELTVSSQCMTEITLSVLLGACSARLMMSAKQQQWQAFRAETCGT